MISHPHLIKAALTADALNLGPHWIYDQSALAETYPEGVHQLSSPLSKYHPNKTAGDLTHYGDNFVLMLRAVVMKGGWDPESFAHDWRNFWLESSSYCDGATRKTLLHLEDPSQDVSTSNDIAGASIALALTGLIGNAGADSVIEAVRERTSFAHHDPETMDTAEFFTRVISYLRAGRSLTDALEDSAEADYPVLDARTELEKAKTTLSSNDFRKAGSQFGLSCSTPNAFPLVLYFLLRNPEDIITALNENALAGGDNAARAIIIALVLTEANGGDSSIEDLWKSLSQYHELEALLAE